MTLGRNDVCWCGSGKKYKACHLQFDDKIAGYQRKGHIVPEHNIIKTPRIFLQHGVIKDDCKMFYYNKNKI